MPSTAFGVTHVSRSPVVSREGKKTFVAELTSSATAAVAGVAELAPNTPAPRKEEFAPPVSKITHLFVPAVIFERSAAPTTVGEFVMLSTSTATEVATVPMFEPKPL